MLLIDTNVWLILADGRSRGNPRIVELVAGENWITTAQVTAEASWLLLDRLGPKSQQDFLRLITNDLLDVIDLSAADWQRCLQLVSTYEDLKLDLVDASLVAVAERLDITRIATLNERDFRVVRPNHCEVFDLVN